jgi:hypothetical protein
MGDADEPARWFRNAWRCHIRRLGFFIIRLTLFLEYQPVVVQELSFEADLVDAHPEGERQPEVGAGQPAREQTGA